MAHRHAHRPTEIVVTDRSAATGRPGRTWPIGVRLGRPEDRDQIVAMVATVFEGHDYIPDVIDEWLVPSEGIVLVATAAEPGGPVAEDQVVAMTRVTMLSETEAWLEGIRVDPQVRGMDVATDLQVAELHWIAAHGADVVRYLTSEINAGSLRLGARHGLVELGRWRFRGRLHQHDGPVERPMDEVRAALGRVQPAVESDWAWASADPLFVGGHGLYEYRGWAFQELTTDRFAGHVHRGEAFVLPGRRETSRALVILNRESLAEGRVQVAFAAGDGAELLELLERLDRPEIRLPEPLPGSLSHLESALDGQGYAPWPHAAVIVERRLEGSRPLPAVDPDRLVLLDAPRAIAKPSRLD